MHAQWLLDVRERNGQLVAVFEGALEMRVEHGLGELYKLHEWIDRDVLRYLAKRVHTLPVARC
jgi:hypothetical protein